MITALLVILGMAAVAAIVAMFVRQKLQSDLQKAGEAKARAEQQASGVPELEKQTKELSDENKQLTAEIAGLKEAQKADKEKIQWVEAAQERLREAFQALASQALQSNAEEFLKRADGQLVKPIGETLKSLDDQIRELERKREGAYGTLGSQLGELGRAQEQLHTATIKLEQSLKSPTVRGSWGQVQLRRVVELAGMEAHVAFDEQAATEAGRPDLIVYLPNRGILPVDAKAPMQALLEAMEASDAETRKLKLKAHADAVKSRVRDLGQKKYWEQFERAPEFVVMFIPNDTCLSAAFEHDAELLEFAFQQRVLLTTPATLLGLLWAVVYGWQQQQIAENAHQIAERGKELYERLAKFVEHLCKTGDGLKKAVDAYDDAVGSLESRVMPAARRLGELGAMTRELTSPETIEHQPRRPALLEAPEAASPSMPGSEGSEKE